MKKLLLFSALLAAGCQSATKEAPAVAKPVSQVEADHAAITAYLKETLDDPASYQLVELKAEGIFSRADSIRVRFATGLDAHEGTVAPSDSAVSTGREYVHKYRAKNKLGALVLNREYTVVFKSGKVLAYRL